MSDVDPDPAETIRKMVDRVLELAQTWSQWDGVPLVVPVEGEQSRTYTPHKAIRRVTDHLIDHLAEVEGRLAGQPTFPDHWHGSMVTTPADLAEFAAVDFDEATSRLSRLAQLWSLRLSSLTPAELDADSGDAWTLREVAVHVLESGFYAESVGPIPNR